MRPNLKKPIQPMKDHDNDYQNHSQDFTMPGSEICAIIESCGKAGLRVLKYGNLYLQFGPSSPSKHWESQGEVSDYPLVTTPDHAKQNAETLQADEDTLRAEQLRMLMIENPMEYERQLRDGELTDEPSVEDDDVE